MQKVLIWFLGPIKKHSSRDTLFKVLFPASFSSFVQYVPHQSVMLSHWLDISCPSVPCVVSHHWLFAHDTWVISQIFMFTIVQISSISTEYFFVVFSHWLFTSRVLWCHLICCLSRTPASSPGFFMFISVHFFSNFQRFLSSMCHAFSLVVYIVSCSLIGLCVELSSLYPISSLQVGCQIMHNCKYTSDNNNNNNNFR